MSPLVTAIAKTLADAFVLLVNYRVWGWTFGKVRVTVEVIDADNLAFTGEYVVGEPQLYETVGV